MVLTETINCTDGWIQQTKRLARSHTAFGVRVISAAKQAHRSQHSLTATHRQILDVETTIDSDSEEETVISGAQLPSPRLHDPGGVTERQSAWARTANQWIAKLRQDQTLLREELVRRENEIVSLRASLALTMDENARLSQRLADSEVALAKLRSRERQSSAAVAATSAQQDPAAAPITPARVESREAESQQVGSGQAESREVVCDTCSQLETVVAALAAAKAECDRLVTARDETNQLRELETKAFISQLDAMFSRAAEAEKLVAAERQKLLERSEQNDAIMRTNSELSMRLAESDAACECARSEVEQAKTALTVAVAKCNRLAAALREGSEKRLTDFRMLTAELETMSSRAVAAETALVEARRSLAERFELLQKRVETDGYRNQQTEQSRAKLMKLIEGICALLQTIDIRGGKGCDGGQPIEGSELRHVESAVNIAAQIRVISSTELLTSTITI